MTADDDSQLIEVTFATIASKVEDLSCSNLQDAESIVCRVLWLQAEVDNGGFEAFFYNSYGDYYPETMQALRAVGASEAETLLSKALALFPESSPSRIQAEREEALASLDEEAEAVFDDLNQGFYDQSETMERHLADFIRGSFQIDQSL